MQNLNRRYLLITSGLAAISVGCDRSIVETASTTLDASVDQMPTPDVKNAKLALGGYAIVAIFAGKRLVMLPHPAVRILGATLIATSFGARLLVTYLDEELEERSIQEELAEQERSKIEADGYVEYETADGKRGKTYIPEVVYDTTQTPDGQLGDTK